MENAYETYQEMLAEIGIHQELTPQIPETEKVQEKYEPTCCSGDPNDIVIHDGAHICWHCGNTVSYKVLVYYNPYHCSGKPVGWNNTVSFERKRGYKSLTHFKEHLRRYMGARFTEYPKNLLKRLSPLVNVHDPNCYRSVQKALKCLGYKHLYKEIFSLIYNLGGTKPYINNEVFADCVTDFMWLQAKFGEMKKAQNTVRKNMPSMYVVSDFNIPYLSYWEMMDILLRRHGHTPYYTLPCLKDDILQLRVLDLFAELDKKDA